MGGVCSAGIKKTNVRVSGGANYDQGPPDHVNSKVFIIMCALDYKATSNPLTCTLDAKNMQELVRACNIPQQNVTIMLDEECTNQNVKAKIEQVGSQCTENDYFIFYYSGHGTNVADQSGDEADGEDEAFCFVDSAGQISMDTIMVDDDFADIVTGSMPSGIRILILTDCCHSGTIADLSKPSWDDFQALSITGCMDSQTSGDVGTGGIFTHSMLMAIDSLQDEQEEYSCGFLYNATLAYDDKVFSSAQDITIQTNRGLSPDKMAWPLVPMSHYKAPMSKAAAHAGPMTYGAPGEGGGGFGNIGDAAQMLANNPQMAQQLGISPQLVMVAAQGLGGDGMSPEDLAKLAAGGQCAVM